MKFGKEFRSQMVPEWHETYMDYEFMKSNLKEIHLFNQRNLPPPPPPNSGGKLRRSLTLYRAFSGLTHSPRRSDVENNHVIHVNTIKREGFEFAETMFLMASDKGGEYELVFFKRLDDEFNKVVKFYKSKVEEVMKEAVELNKQMHALVAFRVKVEKKEWTNISEESVQIESDVTASRDALSATTPFSAKAKRSVRMDAIDEDHSIHLRKLEESSENKGKEMNQMEITIEEEEEKKDSIKPAPIEILQNVKFNSTQETPRSTIKGVLQIYQTDLKFSEDNLNKAEEKLKKAFVSFHHKLRLLKSYSFLNILAFSKIMKKYDKVASRNASKAYMKMVDSSYLGNSDEVSKLMERVEVTFIKHFSNSNRSKGMNILRPKARRDRHRVTFSMGFLVGCTFALILALVLIIRARKIFDKEGRVVYMDTLFPLYSLFGFVVLHMLMYAGNIYFWRRYRVNYSFIFGFKEGTELGYREVLLVSCCLSVLALASIIANLDMEMDPITQDYKGITELLPLVLVALVIVVMLCPFNIVYRSSRYFLLVCVFHCLFAPLYKVTLPDFFLADQITSQVQALRSLQFYICYYGWGDYKRRENTCQTEDVFKIFSFIVAVIPYWWRLLQCVRRFFEERDIYQGYNGLKYFSTIVAVCARIAYSIDKGIAWKLVALIASIIATIVSTYWDIVIDWGLFQPKSTNRWLRDKLLVPQKSVYYIAMVLNVLLRLAWMQTVMNITVFSLHRQTMISLVAILEIIRRGIWNFFRLENEHLNNVGKYRAFRSVPLPFNYDEDGDKDE